MRKEKVKAEGKGESGRERAKRKWERDR